MAITNHERVGKAMNLLKSGLAPFVEREFKSTYKDRLAAEAKRASSATTRLEHEGRSPNGMSLRCSS